MAWGDEDGLGALAESGGDAPSPRELAGFPCNDFGNARRLMRLAGAGIDDDGEVRTAGSILLYLREVGWIGFNGRYWDQKSGEQIARRMAHKVAERVRGLMTEFVGAGMPAKDFLKFADACGQAGATAAMLKQAEPYLTVDFDAFDRDPLALNLRNGVLRFRRGADGVKTEFTPGHRASDRFTRMAEVSFDAAARCPIWDAALLTWLPQAQVRDFLHRCFGYAATGCTHEQVFVILQGLGRDGKSTLVGLLRELLGTYACAADVSTFLDAGPKRGGDANADVARLAGDTRLISTSEPPRGAKLADNMLKSFTGGAPILARQLHKAFVEFTPLGKVVMEVNALPKPQGSDEGIWRRLVLILFENQIKDGEEDKQLPAKLRAEMAGILNWLILGVEAWLREGLKKPDRVLEALQGYRKASSPFGDWFMDRLIPDKEAVVLVRDLYADFKEWMAEQGHEERQVMTMRAFGDALNDRQVLLAGKDGQGRKRRRGVRIRPKWEEGGAATGDDDGGGSGGSSPPAGDGWGGE